MRKTIIVIIALFSFASYSQVIAPNFGETDIYGNDYNLYEQLDLGKPVVLDFFGTG
jgi:hypothetical protein